jgi:hypothetical protein
MLKAIPMETPPNLRSCQVVKDKGIVRFGISFKDEAHKIFYYFIQKDGSIGVGNYFLGSGSARQKLGNTNPAQWKISINNLKKIGSSFIAKKTSFHKSGLIVEKNNTGERRNLEPDAKSISFEEVKDPIQLRVMYLSHFKFYPQVGKNEIINLLSVDRVFPIMCKIFIAPKVFDFIFWMLKKDKDSQIFNDIHSLSEFDLNLYIVFRRSNNEFIPSGHVDADLLH